MHYYEVAPTKIIRIGSVTFTYSSGSPLQIGQIVHIEIGNRTTEGVVISQVDKPSYETKQIISILEDKPLPTPLVKLAVWMAEYYASPLANVLQTILPTGLQKKRRELKSLPKKVQRERTNFVFNKEQLKVLETINEYQSGTFLLEGITGSGKTAVYIEQAKCTIEAGRSVIVLVPEIALTSQLVAEFSNNFANLQVTHSKMTESTRHQIWQTILNSTQPVIMIGPRSALFAPLRDVGLIIVDEAHEPSYKQEQTPRYSALRAATMLGRFHEAIVVLGSATPSVTDRYLADRADRPVLRLTQLARPNSSRPNITVVDMTKRDNFNHRFLSKQLLNQIETTLKGGKQTLIFHNRRGSSSSTMCESCGWMASCPRCYLPLSLHADSHQMICHICGLKTNVPTNCPECKNVNIIHKGVGTKLIESELTKLYAQAKIARFDADSADDSTLDRLYDQLYKGEIDIAIGTQVIAKGLDLPHLRTVGVIQADAGLAIPDFSSNERTFQLLSQVVGRVGRNEHRTNVIVQTYQPTHPSITHGINQDYESFYENAIQERERGYFPPFTHLAKITCVYKTETAAITNTKKLAAEIKKTGHPDVRILGPAPAFYERLHGNYRWQLILKSPKREYLIKILEQVPRTHWQCELDPASLL